MFFKNIRVARLQKAITSELLEVCLGEKKFTPCEPSQAISSGWFPPLGSKSESLVHTITAVDGSEKNMMCLRTEERILPTSVVNDYLESKCDEVEEREGKRPAGRLKQALKDDVIASLLPKAFTKASNLYVYINNIDKTIIIDTASANKAEELIAALRQAIEGLPVKMIKTKLSLGAMMTYWIQEKEHPSIIKINSECELVDLSEEKGAIIKSKNQDLSADEMINHIDIGKNVSKLSVTWADHLDLIMKDDFSFNRLKFSDELLDKRNDCEDKVAQFNVDFELMSSEIGLMILHLIKLLGGEIESN